MNSSSNISKTAMSSKNLMQAASAQGSFKTFEKAIETAGLTKTLSGAESYTVFAPTDAAFDLLPPGKLEHLLKLENKGELISLLNHHVVAGRSSSSDVGKLTEAKTLNGANVPITLDGKTLRFGGSEVTLRDIESSNGLVHGISTVAFPTTFTKQ